MNTSELAIVKAYRDLYTEAKGADTLLSDVTILKVVTSVEGDGDAADLARIEAMEKAEDEATTVLPPSSVAALERRAIDLASHVDAGFTAAIDTITYAKETVVSGAIMIEQELRRVFSKEDLASFPIPDSVNSAESPTNNPDKYKAPTPTKDGTVRNSPRSFYNDLFEEMPSGKNIRKQLTGISAAINETNEAPAEYKRMSKGERKAEQALWQGRVITGRNLIKRAMKLLLQWDRIKSELPKVAIQYVVKTDKDGNESVIRSPKPIMVYDPANPVDMNVYSVTSFLSFKPDVALAKGGTVKDLWETAGRQGGEGQGDENGGKVVVKVGMGMDDTDKVIATMAHQWDPEDADGRKRLAAFKKHLTAKDKAGKMNEDLILSFGDFMMAADEAWTEIEPIYAKLSKASRTKTIAKAA